MIDDTEDLEPVDVPPPAPGNWWGAPPPGPDGPTGSEPPETRPPPLAVAIVAAMVLAGLLGFAVTHKLVSGRDFNDHFGLASPFPRTTPTLPGFGPPLTNPPASTVPAPSSQDPDAAVLSGLVVHQRDVDSIYSVALYPNGNLVAGTDATTLNLCNGTFPSEPLRRARLQVDEVDPGVSTVLSTEAVLYQNPAATTQAFSELRSVRANCPPAPVVSPVGEPTITTAFGAAPDTKWAHTPGVERLAYDSIKVDDQGGVHHSIGVYLRRGRAFLGVYFYQPDGPQPPVEGQTTIAGIEKLFEQRLAKLPAAVVNRG